MRTFEKTVEVDSSTLAEVNRLMMVEPSCEAECFGEDEAPFTLGVSLPDGVTAYLQCRGVKFGTPSNTAYADAMLCDADGIEIESDFAPPQSGGFGGTWHIEGDDIEYAVTVVPKNEFLNCEGADHLPPCPRCGAHAVYEEMRFHMEPPPKWWHSEEPAVYHTSRIKCANGGACYHTQYADHPDHFAYGPMFGGWKLPEDADRREVRRILDAEWRRLVENYKGRHSGKCSCGKTSKGRPGMSWKFCPWCGDSLAG